MSKYLSSVVVVSMAIACGGTTNTSDEARGGTSSGGASSGGKSAGGESSGGSTGKAGSVGTGGSGGSIGIAGSISVGGAIVVAGSGSGGAAGGPSVDPRCPAQRATGACTTEETGASCEYDVYSGCLCYSTLSNVYALCTKVDPACGTGGSASAPPPPADEGIGGFSVKIALPPHQRCSCTGGNWTCTFGY